MRLGVPGNEVSLVSWQGVGHRRCNSQYIFVQIDDAGVTEE